MSKTIEEQLKDLEKQEHQLKKQSEELAQKRQHLENEKAQKEENKRKFTPYVKQFQDLGFFFEADKKNELYIKPIDLKGDEYLEFIYFGKTYARGDILDKILENIRLGRKIEKDTPFKMVDIYNGFQFKFTNYNSIYFLTIKHVNDNYTINIIKKSWDDKYNNYRKQIDHNLFIVVESTGYQKFDVSWEYSIKANNDNLIQRINEAIDILNEY